MVWRYIMFCAITRPVLVATTLLGEMGPPMVFQRERCRREAWVPPGVTWWRGTVVVATVVGGTVVTVASEAKEKPRLPVTTTTRIAVMRIPAPMTVKRARRMEGASAVPRRVLFFLLVLRATHSAYSPTLRGER